MRNAMRLTVLLLVIALFLPFIGGCKVPDSVFGTLDTLSSEVTKAKNVCTPLITAAVLDLDNKILVEKDPVVKAALILERKNCVEVKKNFPKILRNLDTLTTLLEKFNDIVTKEVKEKDKKEIPKEAPKPDTPAPTPVSTPAVVVTPTDK